MFTGTTVFSQLMDFLPMYEFRKCVDRYDGNYHTSSFSCMDQYLCMGFAQLTYRESLRDIEACLRSRKEKLYHLGIRGRISRSTLAEGALQDVNILDILVPEPGSFYVMDRGYLDFQRLYVFTQLLAFFVTRTKKNTKLRRIYSHPVDRTDGLRCDQTVMLVTPKSLAGYPEKLRRVKYFDAEREKQLVFLTNNFVLPALTMAKLYKCRWQIELFFKWIKQHLRIKAFYGTSDNAVKLRYGSPFLLTSLLPLSENAFA